MKKRILPAIAFSIFGYFVSNAQVAVGTFTPEASAQLDVSSSNKGLLVPRIALSSTTVSAPIAGTPAQSLYIYNTATAGDVNPGFYYWDNSKWNRVLNPDDVSQLETLTTFTLDADGHTLNYLDEQGGTTTVDLATVIDNFETVTSLLYDGTANTLTYRDEDNVNHLIDVATLVKQNETLTTLGLNADGVNLDYVAENGVLSQIDLSEVIENLETVTNLVYDDTANTLTYNDEDGVANSIDIDTLVKANETLTSLVDNEDGTFTYTDEAGTGVSYDVKEQVVQNAWALEGNAASDPATNFLGTTDAQPLIIKTDNVQRLVVTPAGNVGLNVAEPTSTFSTQGSESKSITVQTDGYTLTANDHTVVFRNSTEASCVLPDPTTCAGRIYYIINNGTADIVFSRPIEMAAGVNTTKLGSGSGINGHVVFGNRIKIQSDGSTYLIIQ